MNKLHSIKLLTIAILSLILITGCSSKPKETKPAGQSDAAVAIAQAEAAIKKAKSLKWIWRDTEKFLKKAKKAHKKGDDKKAIKLANKAKSQAEMAIKQYYAEQGVDRSIKGKEGVDSYTVAKGDSLWAISGKSEIYGDPYRWPLIYKANSGKIKDADLIYPGQDLSIDTAPSADDVAAAVRHARTRGAWSLGTTEASDKAYLGQ